MGRGKAMSSLELIRTAQGILERIQPATVRAVCYKLFTLGVIRSMAKPEVNRVGHQLVWARERGVIPWSWIVDDTREPRRAQVYQSPSSFAEVVKGAYRTDPWQSQPLTVEVWSEKATVGGVLAPVLETYAVPFRVNRGYASATAVMDMAVASQQGNMIALYVGDFDPSGLHMSEEDLPARLAEYGASEAMRIERIAITAEDADGDIPSFDADTKVADPRWQWFRKRYGTRCWELDALDPVVLRDRVETAIKGHIAPEPWERIAVAERAITKSVEAVMDGWIRCIPRQASKCARP